VTAGAQLLAAGWSVADLLIADSTAAGLAMDDLVSMVLVAVNLVAADWLMADLLVAD
jgi:hypothetical protein